MSFDELGPAPASPLEGRRGQGGRRLRLAIGAAVIVIAVGVLIAQGRKSGVVYYVTVSELLQQRDSSAPRGLRVAGKVVPGSIERGGLDLRFRMTDGSAAVPVTYHGVVPDTFAEDGEVVVEGKVTPTGVFEATFLMAKCPSKYQGTPGTGRDHPQDIPKTVS